MARMTKTTKANLMVADKIVIEPTDTGEEFFVKIYRGGKLAYLADAEGPITYETVTEARRTIRRIRKDIEPVTI